MVMRRQEQNLWILFRRHLSLKVSLHVFIGNNLLSTFFFFCTSRIESLFILGILLRFAFLPIPFFYHASFPSPVSTTITPPPSYHCEPLRIAWLLVAFKNDGRRRKVIRNMGRTALVNGVWGQRPDIILWLWFSSRTNAIASIGTANKRLYRPVKILCHCRCCKLWLILFLRQ